MMQKRTFALTFCLAFLLLPALTFANTSSSRADEEPGMIQPNTDYMTEGFEIFWPPEGWTRLHLGDPLNYGWGRTSSVSHSGTYSARCGNGPLLPRDEWLVTETLDFSTLGAPTLEWYEQSDNWVSAGDHHAIYISTTVQDDPEAFTLMLDMTPADHTPAGFGGDPMTLDLSAFAGEPTVYIAFRYTGSSNEIWYIDDVRLYQVLYEHDAMAVSVSPNGHHYTDGDSFTPSVLISNEGQNTESFDVVMEIDASGTTVYSETLPVTNLPSAQTTFLSYPSFTVSAGHLYTVTATTMLVGDQNEFNDTATAYNNTYTQQRVPMGILFTNSGCGPCVAVNQALDAYMPSQGNEFALMRVHVNWPNPGDIMYTANPEQCSALTATYGVSGVPSFFLDGSSSGFSPGIVEGRKLIGTSSVIGLNWNPDSEVLTVVIDHVEPVVPANDWFLRVVITEDNIHHNGGNGEPIHMQAFRYMYPDVDGTPVPTTTGSHQFVIPCPLNPTWVYDELRATVYVQKGNVGEIMQAASGFLLELETSTPVGDRVATPFNLDGNYPNPFNPSTTIKFSLPGEQVVELDVYALNGRHVATLVREMLPAGDHQIIWDGRNDEGAQVASGTYIYRIKSGDFTDTKQMMLVK